MNRTWTFAGGMVVLTALVVAGWTVSRADDKAPPAGKKDDPQPQTGRDDLPLRDYMRKKLHASNQILEGLCTDDSTLVAEGARTLNELSDSERWRVTNDPMYRQFSGDFRQITQQLMEAAEKKNMDRAALKWMDVTMSCIDCHSFVRGIRIADSTGK